MAQYEHLPIYRDAMRLAVHIENTVRGFGRYHKYTLGSDLRNGAHKIVELVAKANGSRDREAVLLELRALIERMTITARICQEVKGFRTFEGFTTTVEGLVLLARQNEGWLKKRPTTTMFGPFVRESGRRPRVYSSPNCTVRTTVVAA